ncbi:MAG: aminotransferase class V-fold PLP-dependent enzyme [Gammaproteobacteria bacterium]|nr:aminotransferase class V-fold PLP-dependent enzyme [Gammaproteobacteria bacterium]MCP5135533.1 aminotransferase class V-fold PLP-dependent enzyme [Gammaproteobacteria bacterium]
MNITNEFNVDSRFCYLNHAGMSPWPKRTRDAVVAIADEIHHQGAVGYSRWSELDAAAHGRMAALLGAQADEVAFVRNTSDALSMIARGLRWEPGQNVVYAREEFPSNRYPWESLGEFGVEARRVNLNVDALEDAPESALISAIDANTRLLAVSAVQYASGLRMDLPRLAAACRERGVLLCVDAIQQVGALPFDVQRCGADFVALGSHKWLLGPEGIGVLWMKPEWRERLRLHAFGWHMAENLGDFDNETWRPAFSARRFEPGTTNLLGIAALNASLSLFEELGIEECAATLNARIAHLIGGLSALPGISVITPTSPDRRAGIVTFRHEKLSAAALHACLVAADVVCVPRGGGVRFSPHFHTSVATLDRGLACVESAIA